MEKKPKSLSQRKMIEARQYIKAKRYKEAQAILERIKSPTAKQWLQKIHKIWFEDTAELVKAGNYEEALAILHDIHHPQAAKWIEATEKKLLADDPFAEDNTADLVAYDSPYHPEVNKPFDNEKAQSTPTVNWDELHRQRVTTTTTTLTKKPNTQRTMWQKIWRRLRIVLVIVIIAFVALAVYANNQQWEKYKDDGRITLDVFCSIYINVPDYRCTEWANEAIKADKKNGFHVYICDSLYYLGDNATYNPEWFANCLARHEIYLP